MLNTLFVGIDVSKRNNVVRFTDSYGDTLTVFSVPNNQDGANNLLDKLRNTLITRDFQAVSIGMESTSIYADHLAIFLRNDAFLKKWGVKVFVLNAKQVNAFKEAYPELPKNDNIDTLVIADYLRFGRISKEVNLDEKFIALRNLTRARFQVAQNLSREKSRFLDSLFYKFSSLDSSKVFSDTFGTTSIAVITDFFSTDDINEMPLEVLAEFLIDKGKNKFNDPEGIANDLKAAARSSYRLSKTVNDSVNQLLAVRLIGIRSFQQQLKDLDKAIESYMQLFPAILNSIPGIGPVYSAGLLAEIADIHRFKNHAALAKYAGIAWTKYQSGDYEASNTRLILSGNKYLKYYFLEASNKVRMHDAEFKRYYLSKFKEVPKHQHKRALALTARKLVRLVYSLLSTNQLYIPPTSK
ncbi:Transposase [Tissierella praeacuta DSM 18095]|uniref:Transposase n=1 Tax=Tissierella praeacuta DSM 18095 TaxID=1123404 RepID=A0A1M4YN39_9FIRM|nr:IS110 family transposase [Tissierella praeacuta]SHF07200.1 Transposase [Tissierella praeacuta DSM 18095]SUP02361.1 Transposase IS116/IS110/IS902 family [Tissierella praeacuta]